MPQSPPGTRDFRASASLTLQVGSNLEGKTAFEMTSSGKGRKRVSRTSKKLQQYQETRHREMTIPAEASSGSSPTNNRTRAAKNSGLKATSPTALSGRRPTRQNSPLSAKNSTSQIEEDVKLDSPATPAGKKLEKISCVPETPSPQPRAIGRKRIRADSQEIGPKGLVRRAATHTEEGQSPGRENEIRSPETRKLFSPNIQRSRSVDPDDEIRPSKKRRRYVSPTSEKCREESGDDLHFNSPGNVFEEADMDPNFDNAGDGTIYAGVGSKNTRPASCTRSPAARAVAGRKITSEFTNSGDLGLQLKVDSPVIWGALVNLRKQITKTVLNEAKTQMTELCFVKKEMAEIREALRELTSIKQGTLSTSAKGTARTALDIWEKKLDESTPHFAHIFTAETFCKVLGYNLTSTVVKICQERSGIGLAAKASEAVSMLIFSLQPYQNRDNFAKGIGLLHCDFKFVIIKNSFYNIQVNSFGHVKETGESSTSEETNQSDRKIVQPVWLRRGFVREDDLIAALSFLEKKNQRNSSSVRETPSRSDIATHGAIRAYRALGSHLHNGREKVKSTFFQDVGYLLVGWSSFAPDVDQSGLTVDWYFEGSPNYDRRSLYTVPQTKKPHNSGTDDVQVDAANKEALKTLYNNMKGMVVIAEHDVFVVSGKSGQRRHSGGVKKRICRMINLIEVSANFCMEYTQQRSTDAFLRSHPDALRCVFVIAVVLRSMIESFLGKADFGHLVIPEAAEVMGGICNLYQFMPGFGTMNSILCSKTLRMNEKEYEWLNQVDRRGSDVAENDEHGEENEGDPIEASVSMGVVAL